MGSPRIEIRNLRNWSINCIDDSILNFEIISIILWRRNNSAWYSTGNIGTGGREKGEKEDGRKIDRFLRGRGRDVEVLISKNEDGEW